jgi:TRAP-type mannitol/chloroaromatic compound transport system substrate-binding protein
MEACWKASEEVYAETSAKNAAFKKVYDTWRPFRDDQDTWFSVAEASYDRFMFDKASQRSRAAPAKKG